MSDYYSAPTNFRIRSRLTVSPVCLTIDYTLRQGEARFSSNFGISSNEITIEGALPTPLRMTADLVCKAIVITPPLHKIMIDFACVGVHWKPDHDYRIVFTEDAIREVGDRPLVGPTFTKTYTTNPLPILTSSPAFGSTSVINNTKIQFVFDRLMRPGRGNVYLYEQASPSNVLISTYDVNMDVDQVNTDNLTTFTIDTLGLLKANKTYVVTSDVKVFRDFDELYYPQLTGTTYTFTTALSTNNQFPDLISFVLSSGTLVTTFKRYRNPGATTIDASATLTGPANWRIRTTPSSITANATQTVGLTYTNGGLRSQQSSQFDFYDIFTNYTANGRGNISANFNYTSIVGLIKSYISSISSSATLTGPANWRLRRSLSNNVSSAFSETTQGDWAVLDATRAAETYTLNTTVDITNGPLVKVKSTTGNGNLTYTMTVMPDNTSAVTTMSINSVKYRQLSKLTAVRTPETDNYPKGVDISDDGLVFAVIDGENATSTALYCSIYRKTSNGLWALETSIASPTYTGASNFTGFNSLSFSSDGNLLALATYDYSTGYTSDGIVKIYSYSAGTWTLLYSINGSTNDSIGLSVKFDSTGNRLFVGTYNNTGKVYVRSGNTWVLERTFTAPDSSTNFGAGGFINSSGDIIILNSEAQQGTLTAYGASYVYTRSGTTWTLTQTLKRTTLAGGGAGQCRALSKSGNYIAIDYYAPNSSTVNTAIYVNNAGTWSLSYASIPAIVNTSYTLRSVKFAGDSTVLVGYLYGRVEKNIIYTRNGTSWSTVSQTIDIGATNYFVAGPGGITISEDESTIIMNGMTSDTNNGNTILSGDIYVYYNTNTIWNSSTKTLTYSGTRADCNAMTDLIRLTPATGFTGNFNLVYTMVSRDGVTTTKTQAVTRV